MPNARVGGRADWMTDARRRFAHWASTAILSPCDLPGREVAVTGVALWPISARLEGGPPGWGGKTGGGQEGEGRDALTAMRFLRQV